jgi:hypothetical protein
MNRIQHILIVAKMALFMATVRRISRGCVAFQIPGNRHLFRGSLGHIVSSTHSQSIGSSRRWMSTSERTEEEKAAIQAAREAKK